MVKFCQKCGTQAIDDESIFCTKCGTQYIQNIPEATVNKKISEDIRFSQVKVFGNQKITKEQFESYKPNWILFLAFAFGLLSILISPLLVIVIVILSAFAVYFDAKAIRVGTGAQYSNDKSKAVTQVETPSGWGVLVLLFWIFVLPYYLFKRREIFFLNYRETPVSISDERESDASGKGPLKYRNKMSGKDLAATGFLLIVLILIIWAVTIGSSSNSATSASQVTPPVTNPVPRTTTTTQPSVPIAYEAKFGETVFNAEKEVTVYSDQKVSSYTQTYSNYPITTQAKSGYTFIFVDAQVKNIGSDSMYASAGDFSIGDSDGNKYDPEMYTGDDSMDYFKQLYKTQKTKGKILFEVPINAKNLKLYYNFGDMFSGTKLASWTIK